MFIDQPDRDVPWAELIRAMPAVERELLGSVLTLAAARHISEESRAGELRSAALATVQRQASDAANARPVAQGDEIADEEWRCGNDLAWLLLHVIKHPHGPGGGFDQATLLGAVGRVAARMSQGAGLEIEHVAAAGLRSAMPRAVSV